MRETLTVEGARVMLGVQASSNLKEVKKACFELAQVWHPDKHVAHSDSLRTRAEHEFKKITQAYELLPTAPSESDLVDGSEEGFSVFVRGAKTRIGVVVLRWIAVLPAVLFGGVLIRSLYKFVNHLALTGLSLSSDENGWLSVIFRPTT